MEWSPLTKDAGQRAELSNLYDVVITAQDQTESLRKKPWSFKKMIAGFGTSPKASI